MQRQFRIVIHLTVFLFALGLRSQTPTVGGIASKGRLHDNVYTNEFLGVEVQLPPSTFSKLDTGSNEVRAILLDTANKVDDVEQSYNFSMIVRAPTAAAPTAEKLVSMLRRNFESQGYESLPSGPPVEIDGQRFVQLDVVTRTPNETFYKSVLVTLRDGYLFGFWVGGTSKETLKKLLNLNGKLHFLAPQMPKQ